MLSVPGPLTARGALHRELRLQTLAVASDRGHRQHPSVGPVTHGTIVLVRKPLDLDRVPPLGVTDVVDRQVVMLTPEERHLDEARAISEEGPRDGLALPLSNDPMLDTHETAASRIGPSRGVANRKDPGGARLQKGVHDDAVVDAEAGVFGERRRRPHANARDDEVRGNTLTVVEDDRLRRDRAPSAAEVECNIVLFVEALHDFTGTMAPKRRVVASSNVIRRVVASSVVTVRPSNSSIPRPA